MKDRKIIDTELSYGSLFQSVAILIVNLCKGRTYNTKHLKGEIIAISCQPYRDLYYVTTRDGEKKTTVEIERDILIDEIIDGL